MLQTILTITDNSLLAPELFRIRFSAPRSLDFLEAGQFVNLQIPGVFLRRPLSICDAQGKELTLIYKRLGRGTEILSSLKPSQKLDALTGLGRGYALGLSGASPLLVGGGAGIPPLYLLAKKLLKEGKHPRMLLGFNRADEVFYAEEFEALGAEVSITTMDGSRGKKGLVTEHLPQDATYFYACGPLPMLKALCRATDLPGQLSLEERMGCGFGVCMGCSIETAQGPRRVCKEGPVFERQVLGW